jgi:signal transduction histidine kinase
VDIVVSIIEQNLEVRVEDNGCGIEPDQLDRVFDPFVTTRAKGTGLGLAIVARIVNQHQGSVTLTNRSLYGMSVSITLPIRPSENSPIEPVNKESA